MSTTATVDTHEGWSFADNNLTPIEQNNEWTTAQTPTTNRWGAPPPTAPFLPLSTIGQPHINDHTSLHWTACYDDYCHTHRQIKVNNYYPHQNQCCRRWVHTCDCPLPHPEELLDVTHERRLNPAKACTDWY